MKRLMDLSAVITYGKNELQCMLRYFAIKNGCRWCGGQSVLTVEGMVLCGILEEPYRIIFFRNGTKMSYGSAADKENSHRIAERCKYVDSSTVTFEEMLDENLQMEVV